MRTKAVAIAPWLEEDRASTVVSLGDQRSQASLEGRRQPGKLCDGRPREPCVFSRAGDGTKGWKRVGKNTCVWCGPPGELKAAANNKKQRCHLQHALNFFTGDVKQKALARAPCLETNNDAAQAQNRAEQAQQGQEHVPAGHPPQPAVAKAKRETCKGVGEAQCRFSTKVPGDQVKNAPGGRCLWCSPTIAEDLADKKKRARLMAAFGQLEEEYKVILRARVPEDLKWVERSHRTTTWEETLAKRAKVGRSTKDDRKRYRANVLNDKWRACKTMGQPKKRVAKDEEVCNDTGLPPA